ncbi:MAG TPA: glycosyltransferase family 4 protein [Nitrospira sp.]|nr:glycosyltransferase family 4 protein [Nitrospira sp.]
MRILFIQPTCDRNGHYGLNTIKLCQALGRLGHDVTLCTNRAYPERYLHQPKLFKIVEVKQGSLNFEPFDRKANQYPLYYMYGHFRNSYEVFRGALQLAVGAQFDVIHATGIEFMTAALLLKKYSGCIPPVVMEVYAANFSFATYPGSIVRRSYKVVQREMFKTTLGKEIKAITVLGEWHRWKLREQFNLPNTVEVAVIPDGGEEPDQPVGSREARNKIGIGIESMAEPVLLFFGTIRRDKGIECLLEAAARLKNERFSLLIAGNPQEYTAAEITSLITRWNLDSKVVVRLGYVPDHEIPYYFYSCDALVLPYASIYTGGSGPLMKGACMHRRPSIVSDVSEMGRLAKEYGIGLVARPEDPADLADKIKDFIHMEKEKKRQMADRALALAKSHTWDKMASAYTDVYRKVI